MKKPVRIGVDATPFVRPIDGIGSYCQSLVKTASTLAPDLDWTFMGFRDDQIHATGFQKSAIIKHWLPRSLYRKVYKYLLPLSLHGEEINQLGLVFYPNFVCFPRVKSPAKKIVVVHDTAFLDCPEYVDDKTVRYLRKFVPKSITQAERIVCVSEFTKERLLFHYPDIKPDKTVVIPAAVDESRFLQTTQTSDNLGLPNDYVLCHGTVEPRKNLELAVAAYVGLPKKIRESTGLVITGSLGWKNTQILATIKKHQANRENIVLTGRIADDVLAAVMRKAKLFLFPSHYEGFGIPVLESLYCNVPVLASDIATNRLLLSDKLLLDRNDTSAWSKAIAELLTNKGEWQALLNTQQATAKNYSWESSAAKFVEIIRELI